MSDDIEVSSKFDQNSAYIQIVPDWKITAIFVIIKMKWINNNRATNPGLKSFWTHKHVCIVINESLIFNDLNGIWTNKRLKSDQKLYKNYTELLLLPYF